MILAWGDFSPSVVSVTSDASSPFGTADIVQSGVDSGVVSSGTIQFQDPGYATKVGMTATGTGDSNIRIWAGDTYANRASAPFRVTQGGAITATSATIVGDIKTHVNVGASHKGIHIDDTNDEMYFWGDRGDGTIEKIVSVGIGTNGYIEIDANNSASNTLRGVNVSTYGDWALLAECDNFGGGYGISYGATGTTYEDAGIAGLNTAGSPGGPGIYALSSNGYSVYASGDAYFTGDVSVLSLTDRTPFYEGDAVSEIKKIKGKNGEIDHDTLPAFVKRKNSKPVKTGKKIKVSRKYTNIEIDETCQEECVGRDLGATISMNTVAIQQLIDRIEKLEKGNAKRTNSNL